MNIRERLKIVKEYEDKGYSHQQAWDLAHSLKHKDEDEVKKK